MELDPVNVNSASSQPETGLGNLSLPISVPEVPFAAIVETMAEAFFTLNVTGGCVYLNQTAATLLGGDRPALIGQYLWDLFQVSPASQLYQQCHHVFRESQPAAFEEFYAGVSRWFAVRLLPVPGGLAAYFQDITERRVTEAALRQEKEFLNVLLDNVQAGIVACDAEGKLKLFNKAARSFHGLPEQPLPPDQWAEQYGLFLPDGETPMQPEDIPLYQALQGQVVRDVEMQIIPRQGPPRILLASGQALQYPEGESQGAVVVMHDITEQKQIETALRDREAQLSSIFQTIPDGIIILDQAGKIVTANAAAERIFRLTRRDITERGYNDASWAITTIEGLPFPEADLPFVQVMRTGKPVYEVEHAIAQADGTKAMLSINASPLVNAQGVITHVVASISDITARKQAEAILQTSEERYRSVIAAVAEGIVLQQRDGSIFTCNASAERILGLTADQLMGLSSLDPRWCTIHEDGSPFPGDQHPAMITLKTGVAQSNVPMGICKPEGTVTWISINTRPIFQPNDPQPLAVVSSFVDMTEQKRAAADLLISDIALQQMPDAILLTDLTGTIERWLGNAEQIFGYTAAEAVGQPVNFLHRDDIKAAMTAQIIQSIQETGEFFGEIPCVRKDGSAVAIETTAKTVFDSNGQPIFLIGINKDITERKQSEVERAQLLQQQIQEQTARLEAEANLQQSAFLAEVSTLLSSSLDYEQTLQSVAQLAVPYFADWCAVDLVDDDGTINRVAVAHTDPQRVQMGWDVAQRFPRHLDDGYGLSEVMKTGKSQIAIAITDEQLAATVPNPEYLKILQSLGLRSAIMAPLTAQERVLGTISFIFADSQRYYSPEDLDLAEDLARRAAIAIDNARLYRIAQQAKQAAETAADRTARLQTVTAALSESLTPEQVAEVIAEQSMAVLEATAALVVLVTESGTELEIVKSIGYTEDLVQSWRRFPLDADVPLAEAVRTGQPVWVEQLLDRIARYPHLAPIYQRYGFQSWIALPLVVEGHAVGGMLLSFQAVKHLSQADREFILALSQQCAQAIVRAQLYEAERRARAEAEQANRVKDEFLAVLSHELRSPLNPIMGWTKILRTQRLQPDKADQALATIERNAKLQAQLIEDLLDISRMLQGKLSLHIAPVNVVTVIQEAIETVQLAASAKEIQIQTIQPCTTTLVLGDANRLQQVIWNLLSNAVKFTPIGGQVLVQVEQVQDQLQIQVIDNGKGISPEFLPHIFDYFRQEDSTTTRKFGGLGLGLAIARQLIEMHGGTIEAQSPGEGLGATFTVGLPASQIGLENPQSLRPPAQGIDLSGWQILIVDDEADMRELAEFILTDCGAQVRSTSSATEAMAVFSQVRPDLLLCDIGMPEMDGYALMRLIRQRPPEQGGEVPAIALTAYAGEYDRQQALAAGFQRHIAKPVEPEELIKVIAQLLLA